MQRLLRRFGALMLLALWLVQAHANPVVDAEGIADIIRDNIVAARQMALQDAMRNAATQGAAHVRAGSLVSEHVLVADHLAVHAAASVTDVRVLDEWADDDDRYHVMIRARVAPLGEAAASATRYRRKVAVTQFDVLDRRALHDLPNLEILLSRELGRRLDKAGGIMTLDASRYLLPAVTAPATGQMRRSEEVATDLAASLGTQLIVSGVIRDTGVARYLPVGVKMRHLDIDLQLTDGISGQVLAQHRVQKWAEQPLFLPQQGNPTTTHFFETAYGRTVSEALDEAVALLQRDINAQPFAARVLQVRDDMVYLDAGSVANIAVGDRLTAYQLELEPLKSVANQAWFGREERPAGRLVVRQVQPAFVMAEMDGYTGPLKAGDVVRFGW